MEPSSSSTARELSQSSQSKKRKSTTDAPAAKKAKKPTVSKAKKATDAVVVTTVEEQATHSHSSDKENTVRQDPSREANTADDLAAAVVDSAVESSKPAAKPRAPRKPKEKDTDATSKPAPTRKKTKDANLQTADSARTYDADRQAATLAFNEVLAGRTFNLVNNVEVGKGKTQAGPSFTAVNASIEPAENAPLKKGEAAPKAVKEKEPKEKKESKVKKDADPKVPKVPKEPKPKADKPPKEKKEKVPKAKRSPKEPKEKAPGADKPVKKKTMKPKSTEIKEWKQYEPKNPAPPLPVNPVIARFLQTVDTVKSPPKVSPPPDFEYIEISYPLSIIHDRLVIREFLLRFEKSLKIVPRYINIVNNPNADWTDLTYRSVILCILRIMHLDNYPPMDWAVLDAGIKELEKTPPDDPNIWTCLCEILDGVVDTSRYTDFTQDEARASILVRVIILAMSSSTLRGKIESDAVATKSEEKSLSEQLRAIKSEWEETKTEIFKLRFTAPPEAKTQLDARYERDQAFMRKQIATLEARTWFRKRKLCPRGKPLGSDAKGNTYWLYIQRDRNTEDWGRWIVVEKYYDLPHPSGIISPQVLEAEKANAPEDQIFSESTEEEIKRRVWYAISTSTEAVVLEKWIRSTAELVFHERLTKPAPQSPTRKRLHSVEVPMSASMRNLLNQDPEEAKKLFSVSETEKLPPQDLITRDSINELCNMIRKISEYWALDEDGLGPDKLPV